MSSSNPSPHQIINVQAYKHNGKLYRQWNGVKVLEVSPMNFVLLMYKTKVKESNGQRWTVREPMLWFLPRDRFFNTTGLIRKSGTYFYTNISSPPIYEENAIKFIDYDLDIKAYPHQSIKIVDKREFTLNKQKYHYPRRLLKIIDETTLHVIDLIKAGEEFFDEDVIETYIKELVDTKDLAKKLLKVNWD